MLCGFVVCSLPGFWPDSLITTVIGSVLVSPYQVYVAPAALSSILYYLIYYLYGSKIYFPLNKDTDTPEKVLDYALPGNQAQFGARRLAQSSIILLQYEKG